MSLQSLADRARRTSARVLLAGVPGRMAPKTTATVIGESGINSDDHPRLAEVADLLRIRKPERVRDGIHALDLAADPLRLALGLLALGDADAVVGGPGTTVEALADAAAWVLPPPAGGQPVRAVHWLMFPDGALAALADCVLAFDLEVADRVTLAVDVAVVHARLGAGAPRVEFFGGPPGRDDGSALSQAVAAFAEQRPETPAATDRGVRFPERANVLIFPGAGAGYPALRSVRELGSARQLGPLLLGPPGVVMGLAEDAGEEEVAGTVALAALIAAQAGT